LPPRPRRSPPPSWGSGTTDEARAPSVDRSRIAARSKSSSRPDCEGRRRGPLCQGVSGAFASAMRAGPATGYY
jgi:hypothetical protein